MNFIKQCFVERPGHTLKVIANLLLTFIMLTGILIEYLREHRKQ